MGLTKNLGWLSKYITADSSGNLGVGVASPLSGGGSAKWLTIDGTTYGGGFISSVNGVSKGTLYYDQASLTFSMYAPTGVGATIHTDGTERMRIFSSGNVFIGSSPTDSGYKLHVNGSMYCSGPAKFGATGEAPTIGSYTNDYSGSFSTLTSNNHGDFTFGSNLTILSDHSLNTTNSHGIMRGAAIVLGGNGYTNGTNSISFFAQPASAATAGAVVSPSAARMVITNSGNVLIGNTADTTALARSIVLDNGSNCGIVFKNAGNNKGYLYNSASNMYFETIGGTIYVMAGSAGVYLSNSATSWTANSDNRLKDINYTIENAVDKLCTLNAVSFSWKSDESKKEVLGLIAQDVEKVFPQVIDKNKLSKTVGDKSEIDDTEYLGVRYQELIPVLVKAIQELTERIKTLENK